MNGVEDKPLLLVGLEAATVVVVVAGAVETTNDVEDKPLLLADEVVVVVLVLG